MVRDVLVAYGSKMGGTAGLAEAIGARLERRGFDVDTLPAGSVESVDGYRVIVLGSAIYTNRWRPESLRLLRRIAGKANATPLWIFHSGPLGELADEPQALPKKAALLTEDLNVIDVKTFGGRLPAKPPGLVARLLARKEAGDFRNFDDLFAWADGIANAIDQSEVPG